MESLEEALAEVGGRLGQCEVQLRESERERDGLARSLQHEITRRETEGQEHHAQVARLTQETALLRVSSGVFSFYPFFIVFISIFCLLFHEF